MKDYMKTEIVAENLPLEWLTKAILLSTLERSLDVEASIGLFGFVVFEVLATVVEGMTLAYAIGR